jgi:hypothetical protein
MARNSALYFSASDTQAVWGSREVGLSGLLGSCCDTPFWLPMPVLWPLIPVPLPAAVFPADAVVAARIEVPVPETF